MFYSIPEIVSSAFPLPLFSPIGLGRKAAAVMLTLRSVIPYCLPSLKAAKTSYVYVSWAENDVFKYVSLESVMSKLPQDT